MKAFFLFNKATASLKFSTRVKGKWFRFSEAQSVQKAVVSDVSGARPRGTQGQDAR